MSKLFTYFLLLILLILNSYGEIISKDKKAIEFFKRQAETAHPLPLPQNIKKEKNSKYLNWLLLKKSKFESNFENINTIEEEEQGQPMQNESSVAINYNNPQNLIASAVDYRNNSSTKVYVSSDGGKSWVNNNLGTPHEFWRSTNDPSVAFGSDGTGYLVYGGSGNSDAIPEELRGQNGVYFARSTDNGQTWLAHIPIIEHLGVQTLDSAFEDKYYIEVDEVESSPYYNYLYCPWKRVTATDSATQIIIARSTDGGFNWEAPVPVSERKVGSDLDTTYGQSFPLSATGPNGEVYLVWNDGPVHGVGFSRSLDAGITWTEPKIVHNYNIFGTTKYLAGQGAYRHSVKGVVRAEAYPVIKCNNAIGTKGEGNLYLSWAADNVPNIYFSKSTDMGDTWTEPIIIHSDKSNDQFFHWMDVDRTNGDIAIMYLDSRNDPENIDVECFVAYSNDMGETWVDRQVSDYSFDIRNNPFPGRSFAGDYSGCAFYDGKIFPSWIDMRNTEGPTDGDSDVFTSIVNVNAPTPIKNFNVELDPERPKSLDLSWDLEYISTFGKELDSNKIIIQIKDNFGFSNTYTSDIRELTLDGLSAFEKYEYVVEVIYEGELSKPVSNYNYPGGAKQPDYGQILSFSGLESNLVNLELKIPNLRADKTTKLVNLSGVEVYRDGEFIKEVSLNSVDTNKTIRIEDTPSNPGFYKYQFKVISSIDENEKQFSEFSNEILVFSGKPNFFHQENFDTVLPKYHITQNWELDELFTNSPKNSLTNALNKDYEGEQSDTLIIYPITSSLENTTTLSFYQSAIIKRGDKAMIEYSVDNMETWNNLATYDMRDYEPWEDKIRNEFDWRHEKINIEEDNKNIFVQFVFTSNAGLNDEGWNIDDIFLSSFATNVNGNEEIDFNLYPNPAQDYIFISSKFNFSQSDVKIYNILGEIIPIEVAKSNKSLRIDIHNLEKGTYFIEIDGEVLKFIKY